MQTPRWMTRLTEWWRPKVQEQAENDAHSPDAVAEGPAVEPSASKTCPKCRTSVTCWRTYADGSHSCVSCDSKRKGKQ